MYTNWGITLYDDLYGEAPPESGSTTFFMLQVGISLLAEVLSLDNAYFLLQCIICFVGEFPSPALHHKTDFIRLLRSDLLTAKRGHRHNVLNLKQKEYRYIKTIGYR